MREKHGGLEGQSHLSGAVGEGSVPFVTSHRGEIQNSFFLPRKCMLKSAARKREGWTLLLSGDFSGRIEITSENTSGRRPLSRLRRSPSAFYSLSRMLFAAIPTQIGPKAVMHFSVFILEMLTGGVWAAKSEKGLTFLLGH